MTAFPKRGAGAAAGLVAFLLAVSSEAAPPWVHRSLTLPSGDWAFDFGFGLGHAPYDRLGPGLNMEFAVGAARHFEIGVRTGARFGTAARVAAADAYGRMFDTETYGQGFATMANPEVRLLGQLIDARVIELGIEGRVYLPFDTGFGVMLGLPITFHFGRIARLDTGVYVPILFYDPTRAVVSFPAHLWFQVNGQLWLGPLLGVRFYENYTAYPIGFGLGYQVSRAVDFKTELLFPMVDSHGSHDAWGLGAGIQLRIE